MNLVDWLQRLELPVSSCYDFIGIGLRGEGLGFVCVVFPDEAIDGGLEIDERMEDAVLEPPAGQLSEETLDSIEP